MARFVPLARVVPPTTIGDLLTPTARCGLIGVEGIIPQKEKGEKQWV